MMILQCGNGTYRNDKKTHPKIKMEPRNDDLADDYPLQRNC